MQRTFSLSMLETKARARAVRLVVTDCDGVLTDNGVYYSESGEVMKRFSIRDGMGVERLRNAGIGTAILTGESSGSVVARAKKLSIEHLYLDAKDKRRVLDTILSETGMSPAQLAYIGDDVNDVPAMRFLGEVGLTGAPADAMGDAACFAHCVCTAKGGHGAFREFAEWILKLRD